MIQKKTGEIQVSEGLNSRGDFKSRRRLNLPKTKKKKKKKERRNRWENH